VDFFVFGLGVFGFDVDVVAEDVGDLLRGLLGKMGDVGLMERRERLHGLLQFHGVL